ncbi:MAG: hypothetical protein HF978_05290 [Desulfobacteraceae bacterium]|nr:hypothetical protein [Desulfobacteraceae bacterium]MBC2754946.1 hypothetical protein [Desulfobacteraceae bacterium]
MKQIDKMGKLNRKIVPSSIQMPYTSALLGNFLIFGVIITAVVLLMINRELYYLSVQEDQVIEWMTFWVFFIAGAICMQAAYRQYRGMIKIPWFLFCVGVFCFFVALEEISWCQRLLGYRPPAYFLEQNFQQEFNVHNVVDSFLRTLALQIVILGFGIVLPAVWLIPAVRRLSWKMAIVPPPILLAPAFLATYILYEIYPWRYSGELVELMLGLGFVFSAMAISLFFKNPDGSRSLFPARIVALIFVVIVLSVIMTLVSRARLRNQPELIEVTKKEIVALGNDFRKAIRLSKKPITHCKLHNRIFAHVEKYKIHSLYNGYFWNLTKQGLPEERAQFFIDPWNTAYWIWQVCDPERKQMKVFIYSFGPNRRRDSVPWKISGDDIGVPIYEFGFKE